MTRMNSPLPDLRRFATAELVELMTLAVNTHDYVMATCCAREAARRSPRYRQAILAPLQAAGMQAIDWWDKALGASRRVQRTTRGNHHLYVVLLDGFSKGSQYGLYVGESSKTPEHRFEDHLNGKHAARSVRRLGKCLLPALYEHLNPLSRQEAKALEPVLAEAFRAAGIRTEGGH